ncbi:amidohydrolase [Rubrivirga sp. IMCC45206]|uniref:amidohydrolase n=1 Tax=Rubrivirga sp. IMCC45206 TaxID=3391614 RepID=UPI003990162C
MISAPRFAVLATVVVAFAGGCRSSAGPSLILHDARVYTLSWADPDVEGRPAADAPVDGERWTPDASAVVVRGGRIVFVGSDDQALAMRGADTRVVDLDGAVVVPGLVESHGHLHEIGEKAEEISLVGVRTEAEMAERLAAADRPQGEWILGTGWDEGDWADALPDRAFLDALVPDRPVVLKGLRGFGTFGNARALEAAGLGPATEDPVGGTLVRRPDGSLTGVLLNNATDLLNDAVPPRSLAHKTRILRHGMDQLLRAGYVSTHHAGVRADYLPAYQALAASDSLPMRAEVLLAVGVPGAPDAEEWTRRGPTADPEAMLQIRAVKAYYDGSLGSRGAKLLEDYADQPGHRGVAGADYGFDPGATEAFIAAGFQAAIHAIGDAGNRDVLDFYEAVFSRHPEARARRHRVEHAQVVHPADVERFGALNLVASMEPGHAVEDSPWAQDRLGAERVRGAYAWRSLRRGGALLIFNADFTGTDWSPFYGLYAATTRRMKDGTPAGGWYPEEAVTAEEALRAYTVWPARASGIGTLTGTLETGKWADFTVLDLDPLNAPADSLLAGSVVMTVVGGAVRFEADG